VLSNRFFVAFHALEMLVLGLCDEAAANGRPPSGAEFGTADSGFFVEGGEIDASALALN